MLYCYENRGKFAAQKESSINTHLKPKTQYRAILETVTLSRKSNKKLKVLFLYLSRPYLTFTPRIIVDLNMLFNDYRRD